MVFEDVTWNNKPEPIWISFEKVADEMQAFKILGETIIQLVIGNRRLTAFVPDRFLDRENNRLAAYTLASQGQNILIELPVETLDSGPRLLVPSSQMGDLVTTRTREIL